MKKKPKIIPMLLGADLNAYSVAMAFHDAYGVRCHAMGRYKCGLTAYSRIVKMEYCSGYSSIDTILPELVSFAEKNRGSTLVLVPCADAYVEFVSEHRDELSRFYSFLIPSTELAIELSDKISFYKLLSRHGLPYPESIYLDRKSIRTNIFASMKYPAVLKPAVSAEYWRSPFPEMRKVYYPENVREAEETALKIYHYGYSSGLVLQRKIPSPDIYVYTCLFDSRGKKRFGVFGKVVLEECGKTSSGNHAAIITVPQNELTEKIDVFLSKLGYCGFANFDILYREGRYYILELNPRQGRSCDHIRCAGINIAKELMCALGLDDEEREILFGSEEYRQIFWHYPSRHTAVKHMESEKDRRKARELRRMGEDFSALEYLPDLLLNPLRAAYTALHEARLAKTFSRDFKALKNDKNSNTGFGFGGGKISDKKAREV